MRTAPFVASAEDYIDLETVRHDPRFVEARRGSPVPKPTLDRWIYRGFHGVKLRTYLSGGVRVCTRQFLDQFWKAIQDSRDKRLAIEEPATPIQREAEVDAAVAALGARVSRKRPFHRAASTNTGGGR
jgi:hypothetical protein